MEKWYQVKKVFFGSKDAKTYSFKNNSDKISHGDYALLANTKIRSKTPKKKTDKSVQNIIKKLNLTTTPTFISLTNTLNTKEGYCFQNCEQYVKTHGGKAIYGWMIWEDKKAKFIEAEFHAVIKKNGQYIDITPRIDNDEKILFVEDNTRNSGRMKEHSDSWYSWSNFKIINNKILQEAIAEQVKELPNDKNDIFPKCIHLKIKEK
ncbi:MAG: hypothetical protein ACRCZ3_04975 [Providencia rustigianii]|uniref:hypothetical protein n=1 Tax=Providencia rustigianii TaxID=158850 RepID=UPI003F397E61